VNLFPTRPGRIGPPRRDGNGSAHMHYLMKALQSPPRSGLSTTFSLPKKNVPNALPWARQQWVVRSRTPFPREQDADRDGAGSQPRLSWGLPQHLKKRWAPKSTQPSLFKKALLGRRCLLTQTMLWTRKCAVPPPSPESQVAPRKARTSHMQGNLHVWFWPGTPVYCTNMCGSP